MVDGKRLAVFGAPSIPQIKLVEDPMHGPLGLRGGGRARSAFMPTAGVSSTGLAAGTVSSVWTVTSATPTGQRAEPDLAPYASYAP